jgi:hypothetical protein
MPDVLVADARPYVQYACDGVQTVFTYPFPILAEADLTVVLDDGTTPAGVSIAGVGDDAGGTVTLSPAPADGRSLTLFRDMPVARTTDFQEAGEFRASAINAELDRLAMMLQQVETLAGQAVKRAPEDVDTALVLPEKAARAGRLLAFDGDGLPTLAGTADGVAATAYGRAHGDLTAVRARLAAVAGVLAMPSFAVDVTLGAGLTGIKATRAGDAHATDAAGRLIAQGPNSVRVDHDATTGQPLGVLTEGPRTNLLHASFNPASQTRTLAAGTYTLSVRGTGSCALSGGPTGTASQDVPVTFTLGGSTAVTFTVSGSLSAFQCEAGEGASSPIETPASGTAARAGERIDFVEPVWIGPEGISVVVEAYLADVPASDVCRLLSLDDGTEANRHDLHYASDLSRVLFFTKAAGVSQGNIDGLLGGWADRSAHRLGIVVGQGQRALFVDGTKAGSDTIADPSGATTLRIGRDYAGTPWPGHVRRLLTFPRRLSDAEMTALTA